MFLLVSVVSSLLFLSTMLGAYVLCLAVIDWYDRRTSTVFVEHDGEQMSVKRYLKLATKGK